MNLPSAIIRERNDDKIVLDFVVAHDDEAFHGHFPERPILPGVVQVDWAMRLATLHLNLGDLFAQDIQIKFREVIAPEVPLTLTVQIDRAKSKLTFSYCSGDTTMSSGQIRLGL